MGVQVALEVEVGQNLTILHAQKGRQLGIRLDRVLLLQVLLLHVGRDGLRDVGARLEGATGATKEGAERIGKRCGELEDRRLAGHNGLTLHRLLHAAATLVSLLLKATHALLDTLELSNKGADRLTDRVGLGEHGLHIILNRGKSLSSSLHGRGSHRARSNRGGYNGGCDSRSSSRGSSLLGLLLGNGCGDHNGRNNYGCRNLRGSSLLGNSLLRSNRDRSTHYTGGRGSIHGGNTHSKLVRKINFRGNFDFLPGSKIFTVTRHVMTKEPCGGLKYQKSFLLPPIFNFPPCQQ